MYFTVSEEDGLDGCVLYQQSPAWQNLDKKCHVSEFVYLDIMSLHCVCVSSSTYIVN
jgi:hypothetical protein